MALSNLVIMITTTVTTIIMVVIALNQTTLEQLAKYRFVIAPAAPAFDQHRHPTAGRDYEVAAATQAGQRQRQVRRPSRRPPRAAAIEAASVTARPRSLPPSRGRNPQGRASVSLTGLRC